MKLWHWAIIAVIVIGLAVGSYFLIFRKKPTPKVNLQVQAPESTMEYEGSVFTDKSSIINGYYLDPAGTPVGVVKSGGKIYSIDGAEVFLGNVNGNADGLPAGGYVEHYGIYPPNSILNKIQMGFGLIKF